MKERGIIMSAPMVRALLDDSKTNTRRIMNPQPSPGSKITLRTDGTFLDEKWPRQSREMGNFGRCKTLTCPYGVAGDRLWVRETWGLPPNYDPKVHGDLKSSPSIGPVCYKADYGDRTAWEGAKWRPSIFMPRWASRITLEITRVRVERLQDISEEDAIAEGIKQENGVSHWAGEMSGTAKVMHGSAIRAYAWLWDSLHGKGAWELNPWVWVLEFKRA